MQILNKSMYNFDKALEEFVTSYYKEHADEFENAYEMEEKLPEIYDLWLNLADEKLGGLSPKGFFDSITSAKELIKMFIESSLGENNPPAVLTDRMSGLKGIETELIRIISSNEFTAKQKMLAINILSDTNAKAPIKEYVNLLRDENTDDGLKELIAEVLCENADEAAELLFPLIENPQYLLIAADILSRAKKDERTYELLNKLFVSGENIPFTASLIGRYGDERFASMLYKALDNCNYLEYMEIKNAIERLGGIVEDYRDFTEDEYYKAIKHTK